MGYAAGLLVVPVFDSKDRTRDVGRTLEPVGTTGQTPDFIVVREVRRAQPTRYFILPVTEVGQLLADHPRSMLVNAFGLAEREPASMIDLTTSGQDLDAAERDPNGVVVVASGNLRGILAPSQ